MPESLLPTAKIPGYDILERLGGGGMGDVFLATQRALNRRVAIKFLKPAQVADPAELNLRFEREAQLMADVAHPNIVAVVDRGAIDDRPYLVMEYVDGESLRQRLCVGEPMPVEQALPVLRAISAALTYLHQRGIVHRDLKPENVLIDRDGSIKVSDFGIAVATSDVGSVTASGQFVGTLDYMAPEQRHGLGVDERADQYALAVMAYEMLSGEKPLGLFKPPSQYNRKLSASIDAAILRGLNKDPDDRYANVEEFMTALEDAVSSIAARRSRWPLVLSAMVMVAAVLLTIQKGWPWLHFAGAFTQNVKPVRDSHSPRRPQADVITAPPTAVVPFTVEQAQEHQRLWADYLNVLREEKNSIGMTLVLIPPGEFQMGSSLTEIERLLDRRNGLEDTNAWEHRYRSEVPRHEVRLTEPFRLGACEVTVAQFRSFVEATGYETDAEKGGNSSGWVQGQWVRSPEYSWRNLGEYQPGDDDPVVNVSYHDAVAFCDWLSQRESKHYRLPSEAEWEYASRAGSANRWSVPSADEPIGSYTWYGPNSNSRLHPVRQKRPNGFQLYDMQGNVWEWCADWFAPGYYASSPQENPIGPTTGAGRIFRGGGFDSGTTVACNSFRNWTPSTARRNSIGFRVARDVTRRSRNRDSRSTLSETAH